MNRSIQSEGAFGVIKQDYGFRQFLLRGHRKVLTEILLVAMAYDMNKLHAKIQQNRTGTQLFNKHFFLFSKSGFTKGCAEKAKELGNVTLIEYSEIMEEVQI